MKNILFLLGSYEPAPSANGICALMIIKKMRSLGLNISCIANMYHDGNKEEMIDGVAIRRINNQLYLQMKEKAMYQQSAIKRSLFTTASVCADVGRLVLYRNQFPIMSPRRVMNYFYEAEKLIEDKKIDTIIAVNIPIETLEATMMLKNKYKDLNCIAYLLDPIYGGIHHRFFSDKEEKERTLRYERKVLDTFDKIIVQVEHQNHYREVYTHEELKKVFFLGVPLLSNKISKHETEKEAFVAVFAGGVSEKNRNPKYIIEVFKRIKNTKLKMYITNEHGFLDAYVCESDNIEIYGRIPHDDLEVEFANADCFINIGNNQVMQAPSKLIEYMSYGKPIVTTYRIDNDTSKKYMDRYPLSLYLNENDSDYDRAASLVTNLMGCKDNTVSYDDLLKLFWAYTTDAFLESIEN